MKVLGVVGSPRHKGNTSMLVKQVLDGAKEKGYETELLCLSDFKINPLQEDISNKPLGVSFPKDDMERIYPSLEKMHALVVGTPIYYDHVAATLKLFIDRLYYYEQPGFKDRFPKDVRAVVIVTYEVDDLGAYDDVVEWLKGRLEQYWKMKVVATLKAEGTTKRPVAQRKDLMEKAKAIGLRL